VEIEIGIKFAVFDRILAATRKVATATSPPAGLAHAAGHLDQVYLGVRHACSQRRLYVRFGGVVADETVDPVLVGEIKGIVLPAIAGMATGATGPVAGDVYEEVVYGFGGLAQIDLFLVTLCEFGRSFPQPVGAR